MSRPLVSIIIPVYNAEPFVAEAVQSALDQTWPNKEVIVVDDGSTDHSPEVVKKFGDAVRFVSLPHAGAPAARNEGIRQARGEYIKFLDADDVLLPDAIRLQMDDLSGLPAFAIPYGLVLDLETRQSVFDKIRTNRATSPDEMIFACLTGDILITAPLYRADALHAVNGFDRELIRNQEWDLHFRMALQGTIFAFFEQPVALYRQHNREHRITVQYQRSLRAMNHRRYVNLKACQLIHDHYQGRLPPRIQEAMFVRLYSTAQQFARGGLRAEAEELFTHARQYEVKTSRIGRLPYRCLRRIAGDYLATRVQTQVRRLFAPR